MLKPNAIIHKYTEQVFYTFIQRDDETEAKSSKP